MQKYKLMLSQSASGATEFLSRERSHRLTDSKIAIEFIIMKRLLQNEKRLSKQCERGSTDRRINLLLIFKLFPTLLFAYSTHVCWFTLALQLRQVFNFSNIIHLPLTDLHCRWNYHRTCSSDWLRVRPPPSVGSLLHDSITICWKFFRQSKWQTLIVAWHCVRTWNATQPGASVWRLMQTDNTNDKNRTKRDVNPEEFLRS